jgi:hypothetical protein
MYSLLSPTFVDKLLVGRRVQTFWTISKDILARMFDATTLLFGLASGLIYGVLYAFASRRKEREPKASLRK